MQVVSTRGDRSFGCTGEARVEVYKLQVPRISCRLVSSVSGGMGPTPQHFKASPASLTRGQG